MEKETKEIKKKKIRKSPMVPCKCGNLKYYTSKRCQECHNKQGGRRLSQILNYQRKKELPAKVPCKCGGLKNCKSKRCRACYSKNDGPIVSRLASYERRNEKRRKNGK